MKLNLLKLIQKWPYVDIMVDMSCPTSRHAITWITLFPVLLENYALIMLVHNLSMI